MRVPAPAWWLVAVACADARALPEPPPSAPAPVAVTVAPVLLRPVSRPVHGAGRLRAADQVALSFPFGGVVAEVPAVRGRTVRRGEVLAVLDAAPARAQLAAATSALEKAERDASRARVLAGTALSAAQEQDAETGLAVARAQVDAARFQARRSVIVAPADGVVLDVLVASGQTTGAGQPVLGFAPAGGIEVELSLAAADARLVDPGTPARVSVPAAGVVVDGVVTERAGGAGPLGGITVVVTLADGSPDLVPGLVAAIDLTPAPVVRPTVPVEALAEADGDEAAVYVLGEDGTVARAPVTLDFLAGPSVALRDGPPAGALVVVDGVPFVADRAAVRVVR